MKTPTDGSKIDIEMKTPTDGDEIGQRDEDAK